MQHTLSQSFVRSSFILIIALVIICPVSSRGQGVEKLKDTKSKTEVKDKNTVKYTLKKYQDQNARIESGKSQGDGFQSTTKVISDEQTQQQKGVKVLEGANSQKQDALRLLQ